MDWKHVFNKEMEAYAKSEQKVKTELKGKNFEMPIALVCSCDGRHLMAAWEHREP